MKVRAPGALAKGPLMQAHGALAKGPLMKVRAHGALYVSQGATHVSEGTWCLVCEPRGHSCK